MFTSIGAPTGVYEQMQVREPLKFKHEHTFQREDK